jgi:nucleoside phosphorylase
MLCAFARLHYGACCFTLFAFESSMLVVLIPSHFEAKGLLGLLEERRNFRAGGADCSLGKLAGEPALVAIIGMGPPHAPLRAKAALDEARARASTPLRGVILMGFAGGLHPSLKRGDIFLTAGAEHLLPHLPENERPAVAQLHTADTLVATAAAKADLHARTGAWLVDMEQAHIAPLVAAAGLPFIGVRLISDEAHEELPHDLLRHAYDQEEGENTPLRLAGHLTRHPFKVKRLASFVRPLPPLRNHMSHRLHTWLKLTGPRLFR